MFSDRRNSIGFLRLFLAGLVLVSHAFPVGGFEGGAEPIWEFSNHTVTLGVIAVSGFFALSGYLITRSWLHSGSLLEYLWRRVLRIFPGYWVCLVVTACVFTPIAWLTRYGELGSLFSLQQQTAWDYVRSNFLLEQHADSVGEVLATTPVGNVWNGSLWTLFYEFECYLAVAVLGVARMIPRRRWIVLVGLAVLVVLRSVEMVRPGTIGMLRFHLGSVDLVNFGIAFGAGAALSLYAERVPVSAVPAWIAGAAVVVCLRVGLYYAVGQLALAYLVLWLAVVVPIRNLDRFGDFSYGVYIYAFPLEQLAVLWGFASWGYFPYVVATSALSLGLAFLSWHLVEHPALSLKRLRLSDAAVAKVQQSAVVGRLTRRGDVLRRAPSVIAAAPRPRAAPPPASRGTVSDPASAGASTEQAP